MIYSAFGNNFDEYPHSEGEVARALENQLPKWHHVHSRHFINRERGIGRFKGGYGEGESDFVCIVPDWGFLVVECKSHDRVRIEHGVWEYFERGSWKRFLRKGRPSPPIAQAWGNMHDLRDRICRVLGPDFAARVRSGYAVCFPNLPIHLQFSSEANHRRWGIDGDFVPFTIDQHSMPRLGEVLERLVGSLPAWTGCDTAALLPFLAPRLNFEVPVQEKLFRLEQDMAVLTERQFEAVQGALRSSRRHHLVSGAAGTGKTVVARRIADTLARSVRGQIRLLCFSKNLAIENRIALEGTGVACDTVHGFMCEVCRQAGIRLPSNFTDDFYDRGLAQSVLQACRARGVAKEQVCIVDECQDLTEANLTALGVLAPAKLVVLGDLQQSIFGSEAADRFSDFNEYVLTQNCRNPREVAGCICAAARIGPDKIGVRRCPRAERRPVVLAHDADERRAVKSLEHILEEWLTMDGIPASRIAILTSRRPEETPLGRHSQFVPWLNCTSDYSEWKRDGGKVYFGTVHGFKGLDADAILLHDVPSPLVESSRFGLAHAYVAVSRSCFDLKVQPQDQTASTWYTQCFEQGATLAAEL
jgi:AAA domain/Nuclease-related domain